MTGSNDALGSGAAELGRLLALVQASPKDHPSRLRAASLALKLALEKGDPHYADVAEALVADAPRRMPKGDREQLEHIRAKARATRRAVAMAHRTGRANPLALADALSSDPDRLAGEVRRRLADGQFALARAVLEVALACNAGHTELLRIRDSHCWTAPQG